jgi:hypothetical protein
VPSLGCLARLSPPSIPLAHEVVRIIGGVVNIREEFSLHESHRVCPFCRDWLSWEVGGHYLGRVITALAAGASALQATGLLIAGVLADRVGVVPVLDAQACLYLGRRLSP